jgi:cytochrome c
MGIYRPTSCRMALVLMVGAMGLGIWTDSATAQDKPGGRASKVEYEGWRQYMVNCARCHGDDAVGGVVAPDLRASLAKGAVDSASFHAVVSTGRREKGMPGFKGVLSDKQIAATYAYVNARAQKRLPAGRP